MTKLLSRSYAYKSPSLKFISSVLRAADALEFDQFRAFAISYLEKMWADDLSDLSNTLENAADTLLLARRCNVNGILKRALYELVISEGFKQSNSTDQIGPDMEDGENQSVLDPSDISLLVHAREKLTMFWMQKATPPPQPAACRSPRKSQAYRNCAVTKRRTHELYKLLVHDSKIFRRYGRDPIWGLRILRNAPWIEGEDRETWFGSTKPQDQRLDQVGYLCSACAKKWRADWQVEKTKLWNDMDTWFKLCNEEEGDGKE